jgi:hypothetical protein
MISIEEASAVWKTAETSPYYTPFTVVWEAMFSGLIQAKATLTPHILDYVVFELQLLKVARIEYNVTPLILS